MSANNGVVRIGRKGLKKFAFGDDGAPFEVDVVVAFQTWISVDESFRQDDDEGNRIIPTESVASYHQAAVDFVHALGRTTNPQLNITTAEALDFIARLREQYDELAIFFRPRLREEPGLSDTSTGTSVRFLEEAGS